MEISPELLLGILGSVTGLMGAAGLFIQILKYLKEKPKVEAELRDIKHYYIDDGEGKNTYQLGFYIDVRVRNKGYRGTTIGDAELNITAGKQPIKLLERYGESLPDEGSKGRIEPNDLVTIPLTFLHKSSYDKLPKQDEIPFELILYHAHGEIKGLKGISRMLPEQEKESI